MDVPTLTVILLVLVLVALIWFGWQMRSGAGNGPSGSLESAVELLKSELVARQSESLLQLRDSIDSANKIINDRLAEGTSSLDRRMSVLGEIENRLGQLARQADNIEAIGKNIQSLSELLRPPKLRGNVGEMLLENLLDQIVPAAMRESQYRFADGSRVDAIIKVADRLMPVDAKFPLEAYERLRDNPDDASSQKAFTQAFKKHVDDIASKYIRPAEKTTDFALMYIPAEAVYYRLISEDNPEAFEYALSRKVIPSSPGHLYAFLASVVAMYSELVIMGEGATLESRRLLTGLNELVETTERLARFHSRMESSLRALSSGFDRARGELDKARMQLEKIRTPWSEKADNTDESAVEPATAEAGPNEEDGESKLL
jgi:DNA recombination protein RmuC